MYLLKNSYGVIGKIIERVKRGEYRLLII